MLKLNLSKSHFHIFLTFHLFYCVSAAKHLPKYWTAEDYPNPQVDLFACGVDEPGFVCDPNDVLTKTERERVNQASIRLQAETNSSCLISSPTDNRTGHANIERGYTVYVAILQALSREHWRDEKDVSWHLRRFSQRVLAEYSDDENDCDDQILIVFSKADKMIWTEIGRNVKVDLSESELNDTLAACLDSFKSGHFTDGIVEMIETYKFWINYVPEPMSPADWWILGIVGGIVLVMILVCVVIMICDKQRPAFEAVPT